MSGTLAAREELLCLASSVLSLGSAVGDHKRTLYITLRKMTQECVSINVMWQLLGTGVLVAPGPEVFL